MNSRRNLRMLWLGAAKRVSLFETFEAAAQRMGIALIGVTVETSPLVPLGSKCEVVIGPRFQSSEFVPHLLDTVVTHGIDVVIPFMDSATVALAAMAPQLRSIGCLPLVSDHGLCVAMEDKCASEQWFDQHAIPRPLAQTFPMIVKSRLGFGARDQAIVRDRSELDVFLRGKNADHYIVQELLEGSEYTIDAYVDGTGKMLGAMSRLRVTVVGGEVESSQAQYAQHAMPFVHQALAVPGWRGPITLQFFESANGDARIIEINPRFGGGAPHSIHAGLPLPEWVISETLGLPLQPCAELNYNSFMTRYRKEVFYDVGR